MGRKRCPLCKNVIRTYAYSDGFHFGSHAPMKTGLCVASGMQTQQAAQQYAHLTLGESAPSQAVSNAEAVSTSDGVPPSAPAQVA